MSDYAQPLAAAVEAARAAGAMLRSEFHRPGGPRGGGAHADVDAEAEAVIRDRLRAACPAWGYRGEELGFTAGDGRHLWLVDPNDGTAAFLQGWRGSAVSIAALRDGLPVLGVVYAFAYPDGDGDLFVWAAGCALKRNGDTLSVQLADRRLDNPGAIVFLSQDADRNAAANSACVRPARYVALPSIAHRLARVAAGDGVATVSLSGPVGWDFAAGHALLRASGGVLLDEKGEEIQYTPDGRSATARCIGGAPAAARELAGRDWTSVFTAQKPLASPIDLVHPLSGRAIADVGRLARAQGCLLGQLAADALGGLVEFQTTKTIVEQYPHGVRDLRDGGTWRNLAGQPTDDSELALSLARSIVKAGSYDRGAALDAYCAWWPHAWDRGGTITAALAPASRGRTTAERLQIVEECANGGSQSNGSLMRISPMGIYGAGRAAEAAAWARLDSGLTHPNPVCRDACAVFVAAIASAIAEGMTPQDTYRAALAEADRSNVQPTVRQALVQAALTEPADYQTHMGWCAIALQNAFYQLLHAPNLEEGIVDTVMRGGDTDTNAAIAGALLGAVHGRRAVPPRWVLALQSCRPLPGTPTAHPQPSAFWPVDALELAEALLLLTGR